MIINIEANRSCHQYYEVGTISDTSSHYHRPSNNNRTGSTVIATDDDVNINR